MGFQYSWIEKFLDRASPICTQTWLRSARNFAKTRFRRSPSNQFSAKKNVFGEIFRSRKSFFAFLGWFWGLQRKTDLIINFLAIFCSRWTYYELCTTKTRRKYLRLRLRVCDASTLLHRVYFPPFVWQWSDSIIKEVYKSQQMTKILQWFDMKLKWNQTISRLAWFWGASTQITSVAAYHAKGDRRYSFG